MSPSSVTQKMHETNRIFEEEVVGKGDFSALDKVYTANARILPPGAPMVEGRENIKDFWRQAAAAMHVTAIKLHTVEVEHLGDTLCEIGRAELMTEGNPPAE